MGATYKGRFAPSPTGPLHQGSLVAALASWLDARAHGGQWLVRIEDVDTPRCTPGSDQQILAQLTLCGLVPDATPVWQSQRTAFYQAALDQLIAAGLAYPCACTRKDIELAQFGGDRGRERHSELIYPGTCRTGLAGKPARAWRLNVSRALAPWARGTPLHWMDRRLGLQTQDLVQAVGDFVLRRADGLWAYQLAVVVDDAAQGVTHVVRGEDLVDNTARQMLLQRALNLGTPAYLHTPLVRAADGEKLSKQHGAPALKLDQPLLALNAAAAYLGLPAMHGTVQTALATWTGLWKHGPG